jgi:exodeoxyribonuclease VII large subunit
MTRRMKSQWDFGELFPAEELRSVLTVSQVTARIRRLIEDQVGTVWVSGEVSNLRIQASGHCYFTLKDAGAQLTCVLFRGQARGQRELLEDGRSVLLHGDLTVYEPRGQYQLRVTEIELRGAGALQAAFERLKARLQAEGLFDAGRKRPLPRWPRRLGVVTSPSAAAFRDVRQVLSRRFPALELILAPVRVQGDEAAAEIARAIADLNAWSAAQPPGAGLDLLLLTRGGGSLEDLWPFNEEIVARAIHASELPVVSAVGHEIDFTISDFVADVRAATPSAGAEIITEHLFAARRWIEETAPRLATLARRGWTRRRREWEQLAARLERAHPRRFLQVQAQRLDELQLALQRAARNRWRAFRAEAETVFAAWARVHPERWLGRHRERIADLRQRLDGRIQARLRLARSHLTGVTDRLRLLSPENTLGRGYSITRDAVTGEVIRSPAQTRPGQRLETRVRGGSFSSAVTPEAEKGD